MDSKKILNFDEISKINGGSKQSEEKKEEPKRTLRAGDCFEIKDTAVTAIRVKVLHDYIDIPALSSLIKVDMKRIYLDNMTVLNEYLNIDFPITHPYIDEINKVDKIFW